VGLFSTNPEHTLGKQLMGVGAYAALAAIGSAVIFMAVKMTMGLRVDPEEEIDGLDAGEHGMHAYDFLSGGGSGQRSGAASEGSVAVAAVGVSPAE
jgi:Amt family ammonium transporter